MEVDYKYDKKDKVRVIKMSAEFMEGEILTVWHKRYNIFTNTIFYDFEEKRGNLPQYCLEKYEEGK
jgi:hypothetical protein